MVLTGTPLLEYSPAALLFVYSGLIRQLGYVNFGNGFTFVIPDSVPRAFAATRGGALGHVKNPLFLRRASISS